MRVSVKWLKNYVPVTVSAAELARNLTMAGNEVKAVETLGGNWKNVSIAQKFIRTHGGLPLSAIQEKRKRSCRRWPARNIPIANSTTLRP